MRWAGLLCLLAGPAFAEPALISFEFGTQAIVASGHDIEFVELTVDYAGRQAVGLRLHPSFDTQFASVTEDHIGKVMTVRVCGQVVIEPMLAGQLLQAEFVISAGTDKKALRLFDLLKSKACPVQPVG